MIFSSWPVNPIERVSETLAIHRQEQVAFGVLSETLYRDSRSPFPGRPFKVGSLGLFLAIPPYSVA